MYTTDKQGNIKLKPRGSIELSDSIIEWDWYPSTRGVAPWINIRKTRGDMHGDIFILPVTFSETTQKLLTTDLK